MDSVNDGRARGLGRWGWPLFAVAVVVLLAPLALQSLSSMGGDSARAELVEAHQRRAAAAREAGKLQAAEVALQLAASLDPGNAEVQEQAMRLWVARAASDPDSLSGELIGRLEHAVEVLDDIDPGGQRAPRLAARAQLASRQGQAARAEELFSEAIAADPGFVHAHLGLALLQRAAGKTTDALATFEKAVAVAPDNVVALNNLAVQYVELDRAEAALPLFQRALEGQDTLSTRANMADTLLKLERRKEAIEHLIVAASLAPSSAQVFKRLGAQLLADERPADAAQALQRSLELKQDDAGTAHLLGLALMASKKPQQAAEVFAAIVTAAPQAVDSVFELGRSLYALGKGQKAAQVFARFLELAGDNPDQAQRVAGVKQLLGKAPAAPAPPAPPTTAPDPER